jgi:hypothetical protein
MRQVGKGGGGGKGGEMTQTLYAHMNKRKKLKNTDKTEGYLETSFMISVDFKG